MTVRHCLECGVLIFDASRCRRCERARARAQSAVGRSWRGKNWKAVSSRLRQRWRDQGYGCVMASDGKCRGRIQADHVSNTGVYQPLCAYHNNKKH